MKSELAGKKNGAKKSKERGEEKSKEIFSPGVLYFSSRHFFTPVPEVPSLTNEPQRTSAGRLGSSGLSLALLYAPGSLRMGVVNPIDTDFRHQSIEIDKGKSCDFDTIDFAIEIDNN